MSETTKVRRRKEAAIALWHRFAPGSQLEWDDEPHKAEYFAAVDAVEEALHATLPRCAICGGSVDLSNAIKPTVSFGGKRDV